MRFAVKYPRCYSHSYQDSHRLEAPTSPCAGVCIRTDVQSALHAAIKVRILYSPTPPLIASSGCLVISALNSFLRS